MDAPLPTATGVGELRSWRSFPTIALFLEQPPPIASHDRTAIKESAVPEEGPSSRLRTSSKPAVISVPERSEIPGTRASSSGGCDELSISGVGGGPVEGAAGCGVEGVCDGVEVWLGSVEVGVSGEPSSEESAGVLDEGFLPG